MIRQTLSNISTYRGMALTSPFIKYGLGALLSHITYTKMIVVSGVFSFFAILPLCKRTLKKTRGKNSEKSQFTECIFLQLLHYSFICSFVPFFSAPHCFFLIRFFFLHVIVVFSRIFFYNPDKGSKI